MSLQAERDPPPNRLPTAWAFCVFTLALGFYLAWEPRFLRFSSPPTGDQPFYLMDVASLAEDGDLDVKNNYDQGDFDKFYALAPHPPDFVGISAPYPLERQLSPNTVRPAGEQYSHHLPGLPILLLPAWKIGSWFGLWWPAAIVGMCVLSALLSLNIFLFAFQLSSSRWAGLAAWLAIAFSAPIMTYTYLIFSELAVGLLVLYAIRRLSLGWEANGWSRLLVVGLCIGYIPWVAWRCVLLSAPLTGYALWQCRTAVHALPATASGGAGARRRRAGSLLLIMIPVLVSAVLIVRYHYFLYGKPFPDMHVPELGDASPFHWPWQGRTALNLFFTNAFALFFDRTFGLLPWAPVYVLTVAGAVAMLRSPRESTRRLVPALLTVVLPYAGTLAAFELWHGIWCPPARYLTSLVPLCAAPLAVFLVGESRGWRRVLRFLLFVSLAAPGWGLMAILLHDARRFWPSTASPALDWLAAQSFSFGAIDLRSFIPAFVTPDETRLPFLLSGWLAACFALVLLASALSSTRRGSRSRASLGWAGALALAVGAGALVASPYLKHKTELVEKGRWPIGSSQEDPRGIAYLDGRIYVACYGTRLPSGATRPGRVVVFDLETGKSETMPIFAGGVRGVWDFPGDAKLGAEGLLYVLNNGPGNRALLAVRPDGEIVHQFATPGNTNVAKGLAIRRDGTFYITDMVGGALRRYALPGDGSDILELRTIREGLSNPGAVEVDRQDRVFVAESHKWVLQLGADGSFLRKLQKCSVRSFAAFSPSSPWLEASCDLGLFSIDTQDSTLQMARVQSGAPLEGNITGITYGADGLLYTMQGGTLVAYRVTH